MSSNYIENGDWYTKKEGLTEEWNLLIRESLIKLGAYCFNPMRAAINFSDSVNTVSKTYASEIIYPNDAAGRFIRGCGLEEDLTLLYHANKLQGIVNGIDYQQYNPENLRYSYSFDMPDWQKIKVNGKKQFLINLEQRLDSIYKTLKKKFKNYKKVKNHLKRISVLKYCDKPLFVMVGRASSQKVGVLFEDFLNKTMLIEEILKSDAFFIRW